MMYPSLYGFWRLWRRQGHRGSFICLLTWHVRSEWYLTVLKVAVIKRYVQILSYASNFLEKVLLNHNVLVVDFNVLLNLGTENSLSIVLGKRGHLSSYHKWSSFIFLFVRILWTPIRLLSKRALLEEREVLTYIEEKWSKSSWCSDMGP